MNLIELPARDKSGLFLVVIESPRGSTCKLKFEPMYNAITLSRALPLGMAYPFDWGFIPSTRGPDGDPVDAIVLHDAATVPGCVIPCDALGVLRVSQKKRSGGGRERNDRLIMRPAYVDRICELESTEQLPRRFRDEIELFFRDIVRFQDKGLELEGWGNSEEASRTILQFVQPKEGEEPRETGA